MCSTGVEANRSDHEERCIFDSKFRKNLARGVTDKCVNRLWRDQSNFEMKEEDEIMWLSAEEGMVNRSTCTGESSYLSKVGNPNFICVLHNSNCTT